ncbi:MAG TPA: hypothetical protein VG692_17290 [Gemmatimonadales bacterium]|nr:hypothetical protein [Gemmatimonadales bacterium]
MARSVQLRMGMVVAGVVMRMRVPGLLHPRVHRIRPVVVRVAVSVHVGMPVLVRVLVAVHQVTVAMLVGVGMLMQMGVLVLVLMIVRVPMTVVASGSPGVAFVMRMLVRKPLSA